MVIRLQIPESPRYTMNVLLNFEQAFQDTRGYYFVPEDGPIIPDTNDDHSQHDTSQNEAYASSPQHVNGRLGQQLSGDPRAEIVSADSSSVTRPQISRRSHRTHYGNGTPHAAPSIQIMANDQQSPERPFTSREWWSKFKQHMGTGNNWIHLAGTMATWFLLDVRVSAFLSYYIEIIILLLTGEQISFYGLGMSSPKVIQKLWDGLLEDSSDGRTVYQLLSENSWHSSIVVSLGALLGGLAMIYVVQHSRPVKAQSLFFIVLGVFLIITGATFKPFLKPEKGSSDEGLHWALVIFYFLCNFFFNLGANATTFIVSHHLLPTTSPRNRVPLIIRQIPAEQFPTEYRCTCNGLSAASGKLGSVIVQLAVGLSGATNLSTTSLGYWLLG